MSVPSFSGIENFRDFGGFTGRHGPVRSGLLFRSGHHANASDEDLAGLARLSLATIIDLRRAGERAAQPSRPAPGFRGEVLVSDLGARSEGPHHEFLARGDLSDAAIGRFLLDYYRDAPFEPAHRDLFAAAFAALEQGPLLIHCTQGKDRTGLLAALIQHALGADADMVKAEFLKTNAAMLTPQKVARMRMGLKSMTGAEPSDVALRGLLGVDACHLDTAFESVRQRSGSIDAYLVELGVDSDRLVKATA